jgi:hypothetical protein
MLKRNEITLNLAFNKNTLNDKLRTIVSNGIYSIYIHRVSAHISVGQLDACKFEE